MKHENIFYSLHTPFKFFGVVTLNLKALHPVYHAAFLELYNVYLLKGENGTSISTLALAIADRKHSESHNQVGISVNPYSSCLASKLVSLPRLLCFLISYLFIFMDIVRLSFISNSIY